MEDLDKILENAEKFIKEAEERGQKIYPYHQLRGVCCGIRALYEQNKVIVELLKEQVKYIPPLK